MLTVPLLLLFTAFALTIASAVGRAPLWAAVFVVVLLLLIERLPG